MPKGKRKLTQKEIEARREYQRRWREKQKLVKQTKQAILNITSEIPHASSQTQAIPSDSIHYAHGHVRSWLEQFAQRIDVSPNALTQRVAELLHNAQRGSRKIRA